MIQFYHRLEDMSRDNQAYHSRGQKDKLCYTYKSAFINTSERTMIDR